MKSNFVRQKEEPFPSFVYESKITVLLKSAPNSLKSHLMLPGVMVLLVSLFVRSNSLSSPFEAISHFGADNHSLPINASPVVNSDTGRIQHFVQTSATGTPIEPCQALLPLPPTNSDQVLKRLGKDEYSNLIVDLCSFSGLEEKDLLERSYADYLEAGVVIVLSLRVGLELMPRLHEPGIGASQFVLSVIREAYKIPSVLGWLRRFIYKIIIPPWSILILSLAPSLNFLNMVRLSSVLFLRWLLTQTGSFGSIQWASPGSC